MTVNLAIGRLVYTRMKALGLRPSQLARRLGYANVSKGIRRIEALCSGDLDRTRPLLAKLPDALEVPPDTVCDAVEETRQEQEEARRREAEAREAEYRASFVPHAIIETERRVPSPIFVAALMGVDLLRRIDLDHSQAPDTFVRQALAALPEKLREGNVPTFGRAVGVVVNYAPDHAVEFDLEGRPFRTLSRARRLGVATLSIGGRSIPRSGFGGYGRRPK